MKRHTAIAMWVMLCVCSAAGGQDHGPSRTPDPIQTLRAWLDAVEHHRLGSADEPLLRVASWDRATLSRVWIDVGVIVGLVREPDTHVFYTPTEREPFSGSLCVPASLAGRAAVPYDQDQLEQLQFIAGAVTARGGEDWVLKRGAVLHSDIAMRGAAQTSTSASSQPPTQSQRMLYLADGQETGLGSTSVHWEMGRRLLDKVRPKGSRRRESDPGSDQTVRLWYLATTVYMQAAEQLDACHVDRSVQLFPRDPEILFFAACAREMLSGPEIQSALRSTSLPRGFFPLVGSEGAELRRAERLFRESLERDPERTEARIRLGRVLGQRGHHQEAIVELRRATMAAQDRLLSYYGHMFLGAEANALDLTDEARQAYERAGKLYPLAQSPRFAMSALVMRTADRHEALAALAPVLKRDEALQADDPWWTYYRSQSREIEGLLIALRGSVPRGPQ